MLTRGFFEHREHVASCHRPNFSNPERLSRCDNRYLPSEEEESAASADTDLRRPVAYREEAFLQSPDSRPLRILSEYLWPLAHFQEEKIQDTIVFFGSARIDEHGPLGRYYNEARELARMVTEWAESISQERSNSENPRHRFVVCSGGGPGIMEAANRGARDAGGKTVGLNIGLPFEQRPNPYITPELSFEFHYFFMRKFWFAYLAKALVVFPGGFGTLDELSEILTLAQTKKLESKILIVLYGSEFWNEIVNFDALVKHDVISPSDLNLFRFADTPEAALQILKEGLTRYYLEPERGLPRPVEEAPEIARTRTS
ncbi:MAG: LOG family protein [Acidobacteriaceae bacterium]|nr:LOG family protein [Acidobacteriaceae bacterium]